MPRVQIHFGDGGKAILVSSDGELVVLSAPTRTVRLTRKEAWRLSEAIDEVATSAVDLD